jgi:hypothetical protein
LLNQSLNPSNLNRLEAAAGLEANGAQPELRRVLISLDVNVRRLVRIARVEEETIRAGPQHRRHRYTLPELGAAKKSPEPWSRPNAPVQRRAAQRTVRCNRLLGGTWLNQANVGFNRTSCVMSA